MPKKIISVWAVLSLLFAAGPIWAVPDTFELPGAAQGAHVVFLGQRVDPESGKLVEGYAFIHYKDKEARLGQAATKGSNKCYTYLARGAKWKNIEPWVMNPANLSGLDGATLFLNQAANLVKWEDAADGVVGNAAGVNIFGDGATIIIGDINEELGRTTAQELNIEYIHVDVTNFHSVTAFIAKIIDRYKRIDVLIANAGRNDGLSTARTSAEDWEKSIALNLDGVFYTCKAALEHIVDGGRIIVTSSLVGIVGQRNSAAYAAAKGGINSYVRALALELVPRRITVNAIAPGDVETPLYNEWLKSQLECTLPEIIKQIPLGRFAQPTEVGALAVFLASRDAGFITGQTIVMDGGKSLGR